MTLISLKVLTKLNGFPHLRVIDNPLHKSTYIGCASLNTNSKVPSLFDLPAKILRKMSAPSKERAAEHRLCCARN